MIEYSKGGIGFGVCNLPNKKKPMLVIKNKNTETKVAIFDSQESAKMFMDVVADFFNLSKIENDYFKS